MFKKFLFIFFLIFALSNYSYSNNLLSDSGLFNNSSINSKNLLSNKTNKKTTVDKVLAIIYHTEGSSIILESDLTRGFQGPRTLEDVVLEKLMEIDAEIMKVNVAENDIDRHLAQVQKSKNLTQDDITELFKQMGYTVEEARIELKKQLMIENMISYRVREKSIIDKKDIEEYYKNNPVHQEANYILSKAFVPYDGGSPTLKKIMIERAIESGEIENIIKWEEPITLKSSDIASDKAYIKELEPNKVTIANTTDNGIFLIRLDSKTSDKLVELAEREQEISGILRQERFGKAFEEYKQRLFNPKFAQVKYINSVTI